MDLAKVEKDWRSRGYSFGIWTDPPGQIWKDYVHDVDELFMVVSGNVVLEMQGKVLRLKPEEEILIPARELHTVKNTGDTESQWLYGYKH